MKVFALAILLVIITDTSRAEDAQPGDARPGGHGQGGHPQGQDDVPGLGDAAVGQQPLEVPLPHGQQHAHHHA